MGNSDTLKTLAVDVHVGLINEVSIRAATANNVFIEGIDLRKSTSSTIEVYNAGVGGADSGVVGPLTGLGEFAGAAELSPNLALINYGINDINNGTETIPQTVSNIEKMVSELRSIDCDPIVLIPTAVVGRIAEFSALRAALHTMSLQDNVPLIDLSATYGNDASALNAAGLMVDNVHPSPAFYSQIGSSIGNLLTQVIINAHN